VKLRQPARSCWPISLSRAALPIWQRRHHRNARARRWVVERGHSWTNRAWQLLIRWDKKATNDLALLRLQFALTAWKIAEVRG
jgi:hypothetical protein